MNENDVETGGKDRQKILEITADANKEVSRATEYAVIVNKKGVCGEESFLADHLETARSRIDDALEELYNTETDQ